VVPAAAEMPTHALTRVVPGGGAVRLLVLLAVALGLAASHAPSAEAATPSQKIVSYARAELAKGVREVPDGSNGGARIRMYGLSTTARYYPAPWCAYFTSYIAKKAGVPIGPGGTGLGYVPYIRSWAQRTGRWTQKPRPGYLITFPQHVGVVETVSANGTLTTIEGNSGNAVRRRYRRWKEASGYVRLAAGGKLTAPGKMPGPSDTVAQSLTARITAYPGFNIAVGQEIDFTSNDSSGAIARSDWDLTGSGRYTARGDNVSRRYPTPGRYTIKLKISDKKGRSATTSAVVTVRSNIAPVAKLTVGPAAQVLVDTTVTADAGQASDADGTIARWSWLMPGDGEWRDGGAKRSVKLTTPGDHSIGLRVYDNDGNVSETSAPVRVVDYPEPVVSTACSEPAIVSGRRLSCRADTSASPVPISRVEWDMNDDGTFEATGSSAGWTYQTPGTYAIRVRATDRRGRVAYATAQVQVTNRAPTARLAGATSTTLGAVITLDATGSSDPDGRVAAFAWDLDGDGQPDAAPAAGRVSYTPRAPGLQVVRVWVTDELGAVSGAQLTVKVANATPVARIVLPARIVVGTVVTLDGSTSSDADGTIARYDWDINGDGTYNDASGPTVPMTFTKATTSAIVRLRVTDEFGLTHMASKTFTVYAG
jgi:hypothetical protein